MWDKSQDETLDYISKAASMAEELRKRWPGKMVFSVGSELTLFSQGMIEGKNVFDRMSRPSFWGDIMAGKHNGPLNAYLSNLSEAARKLFRGPLTYFSLPFETVDWKPFDFVGVDHYRDARIKDSYGRMISKYNAFGKPVDHRGVRVLHFPGRGPARSQRLHDNLRDDGRPPRAKPEVSQDVLGYGACPAPSRRALHP